MADHSRPTSHEFCSSFGFGSVCKVCKSFVSILSPKKTHNQQHKDQKPKSNILQDHHHKVSVKKSSVDEAIDDIEEFRYKHNEGAQGGGRLNNNKHQSNEHYYYTSSPISSPPSSRNTSPSRLSRTISRIFRTTSVKNHNFVHSSNGSGGGGASGGSTGPAFTGTLSRNASRTHDSHVDVTTHAAPKTFSRSVSLRNGGGETPTASTTLPASFSRNASRRSSTPIMFSNSTGLVKPPPTEMTLECTLEELCFGCVKKMKVTRDAITDIGLAEEEEVLTIKVKPGWTKGTKITFEGKGNERLGTSPADVIFVIGEKRHPLFKRDGDDLELAVEIPLVKALTGCTISIPLLGGEKMSLTVDDIICPGYEKIIAGQGMPKPKEEGTRGNLIVTFLVAFPTELTEEQKSDVVRILEDSC
ncbi:uncharacterized protein LOC132641459 isoform X2 [Lycium barbarum]|uniref:uncharacterized protein LOC132641459 isoform X2 n=1 Tax=Lycium barbarum TaxID=112863 RepID=UPI00293E3DAB|nr:uncharacterized protein LOC132641459 isoform X2 [Lycium barbarum]